MKLFVSGLSNRVTDAELKAAFLDYGEVRSATVVFDRESGRSRGYGFVELAEEARLESMQNIELDDQLLAVERRTEDQTRSPTP